MRGLEHVERAVDHHVERDARLGGALRDPHRRQVEHDVHAFGDLVHGGGVPDVAADQGHARVGERCLDVAEGAALEVVHDHDACRIVLAEEQVDGRRADQAAAAGHEDVCAVDVHAEMSRLRSCRAGLPTTRAPADTSRITVVPMPTRTSSPRRRPFMTLDPLPM